MKKRVLKAVIIFLTILICYNCGTKKHTIDNDQKSSQIENAKYIQSNLNLTDEEVAKVISNDSVTNQVMISLKDSLSPRKINKHLKPFINGKNSVKGTVVLLMLQTKFKDRSFEVAEKKESNNFPEFDSMDDLDNYLKKTDSIIDNITINGNTKIRRRKSDNREKVIFVFDAIKDVRVVKKGEILYNLDSIHSFKYIDGKHLRIPLAYESIEPFVVSSFAEFMELKKEGKFPDDFKKYSFQIYQRKTPTHGLLIEVDKIWHD